MSREQFAETRASHRERELTYGPERFLLVWNHDLLR